jgi:hypothetical protein
MVSTYSKTADCFSAMDGSYEKCRRVFSEQKLDKRNFHGGQFRDAQREAVMEYRSDVSSGVFGRFTSEALQKLIGTARQAYDEAQ